MEKIALAPPLLKGRVNMEAIAGLKIRLFGDPVLRRKGREVLEEGCLSIPGICIKVKRAKKVVVVAQDEFAKSLTIEAQDLLACVLQHEIDHLKGKVIVDYASFLEKLKIKKRLAELKKRSK